MQAMRMPLHLVTVVESQRESEEESEMAAIGSKRIAIPQMRKSKFKNSKIADSKAISMSIEAS